MISVFTGMVRWNMQAAGLTVMESVGITETPVVPIEMKCTGEFFKGVLKKRKG